MRRRTHCFSYEVSLVYIRMWQPRGSAPKGGDDVMAFMIRFSAMARTCPGPGNRNLIYKTRNLSEIASDNLTY